MTDKATIEDLGFGVYEITLGTATEIFCCDIGEVVGGFRAEVASESSGIIIAEIYWEPTGLSPRSYKTRSEAENACYKALRSYADGLRVLG